MVVRATLALSRCTVVMKERAGGQEIRRVLGLAICELGGQAGRSVRLLRGLGHVILQ